MWKWRMPTTDSNMSHVLSWLESKWASSHLKGSRLPEQGEEGCWLHVGEFNFSWSRGHPAVEHSVKDGTASGQDELMGRYPLGLPAFAHDEPDVAEQLVVEEEGKALLQGTLRRLPVVHRSSVEAGARRGGGRDRSRGWHVVAGQRDCGCTLNRVGRSFMIWRHTASAPSRHHKPRLCEYSVSRKTTRYGVQRGLQKESVVLYLRGIHPGEGLKPTRVNAC